MQKSKPQTSVTGGLKTPLPNSNHVVLNNFSSSNSNAPSPYQFPPGPYPPMSYSHPPYSQSTNSPINHFPPWGYYPYPPPMQSPSEPTDDGNQADDVDAM